MRNCKHFNLYYVLANNAPDREIKGTIIFNPTIINSITVSTTDSKNFRSV